MTLLDGLLTGKWTGDAGRDDAINRGLLNAGLQLMQSRGRLLPAVGQAGLLGVGSYQNELNRQLANKRIGLQDTLLQSQIDENERQKKKRAAIEEAARSAVVSPATQALAGGGGPTVANAEKMAGLSPQFDSRAFLNKYAAIDPLAAMPLMTKDDKPIAVSKDQVLLDPRTMKPLFSNVQPDAANESAVAKLIRERDKFPIGDPTRRIYDDAIAKASTHQPSVSVSYGAPVAGVNEKGDPVFFQPGKGGGAPAIVPGVKPAPQNRDTKLPAELQRMQIAGDAMGSLLNDYEAMLKKYNPRDPMVQANPAIRAEMQSLKRNLELQFKELQALGALAGPDIEIMRQALSDPFSWQGAYFGREGLMGQVAQARSLLQKRRDAVMRSQGKPGEQADNDPLGLRK